VQPKKFYNKDTAGKK